MANTEIIYKWKRLQDFAQGEGFTIADFGETIEASLNELNVISELTDRLVWYASKCGSGKVSAVPTAFGSPSGGIRMRFEDPGQATLFKLTWP